MKDVLHILDTCTEFGVEPTLECAKQAADEIRHLRQQRDELQAHSNAQLDEVRRLRAAAAGRPIVPCVRVGAADLPLPQRAKPGDSGRDLRADFSRIAEPLSRHVDRIDGDAIRLHPGARIKVGCGFAFEIPHGHEGQVRPRSSWSDRGLDVMLGTVDSGYRGEVYITMMNLSAWHIDIRHGDRVAQIVFCPVGDARMVLVDELSPTERGDAGHGSSGVR